MVKVMLRSDDSPETWAPRLRKGWERFENSARVSVEAALALGRDLIEAKGALPHGQFGRLFADHEDAVAKPMEFSRQWAARLMKLAAHPTIGNVNHGLHLPSDINALGMLARLSEEEVEEAIADGRVTRNTTRREVKALVEETKPRKRTEPETEDQDDGFGDLSSVADSQRLHAMADVPATSDNAESDTDSIPLAHLKACWRRAGKRDRNKFLQWIGENQS